MFILITQALDIPVCVLCRVCHILLGTLQWRHNECGGILNHRRLDCLLNHLFRCRSKKISKLSVTGLCEGMHQWPVDSPHKGPVMRKIFPFDDSHHVIQQAHWWSSCVDLQYMSRIMHRAHALLCFGEHPLKFSRLGYSFKTLLKILPTIFPTLSRGNEVIHKEHSGMSFVPGAINWKWETAFWLRAGSWHQKHFTALRWSSL